MVRGAEPLPHMLPPAPAAAYTGPPNPGARSPMLFREYPLLNTPNMVAVILREASSDGGGTLGSCTDRLLALLDAADEILPPEAIGHRLARLGRERVGRP